MVVSRMKAEDAESISGRTGRAFEDLHFVWAALGATGATVACLVLISAICYFAVTSPVGYNKNPMAPSAGMSLPSAFTDDAFAPPTTLNEEELVLLLDTVVTRDGRISKVRVVEEEGPKLRAPNKAERQAVLALLDAISKARFQPARVSGSPVPVAVNMVWLYASLTVKGKMPELQIPASAARQHLELDPGHAAERAGRVDGEPIREAGARRTANPRGVAVRVAASGLASAGALLPVVVCAVPSRGGDVPHRIGRPQHHPGRVALHRQLEPLDARVADAVVRVDWPPLRGVGRVVHPLDGRIFVCDLERNHGPVALAPERR